MKISLGKIGRNYLRLFGVKFARKDWVSEMNREVEKVQPPARHRYYKGRRVMTRKMMDVRKKHLLRQLDKGEG